NVFIPISLNTTPFSTTVATAIARLYNVTDGELIGSSHSPLYAIGGGVAMINAKFSITSSKVFSVDAMRVAASAIYAAAAANISGYPEIYTQVELRKVG